MKPNLEKPIVGQNWYLVKGNVSNTIFDERFIFAENERNASLKFNAYHNNCAYNLKVTLIGEVTELDVQNWKIKMDHLNSLESLDLL